MSSICNIREVPEIPAHFNPPYNISPYVPSNHRIWHRWCWYNSYPPLFLRIWIDGYFQSDHRWFWYRSILVMCCTIWSCACAGSILLSRGIWSLFWGWHRWGFLSVFSWITFFRIYNYSIDIHPSKQSTLHIIDINQSSHKIIYLFFCLSHPNFYPILSMHYSSMLNPLL